MMYKTHTMMHALSLWHTQQSEIFAFAEGGDAGSHVSRAEEAKELLSVFNHVINGVQLQYCDERGIFL